MLGWTKMADNALATLGFARVADPTTMKDDEVRYLHPFRLVGECHEIAFDLLRRLLFGKIESIRESFDMRIDYHSYRGLEPITKNYIGCLARHAV